MICDELPGHIADICRGTHRTASGRQVHPGNRATIVAKFLRRIVAVEELPQVEYTGDTPRPTKTQVTEARQSPPDERPGTVLHRLLKARYGVKITICTCQEWIDKMNVWGPSGCRENIAEIVDHLFDEASTNPQVSRVIRIKLAIPIIGPIEGKRQLRNLVTEAIETAEGAMQT